MTEIVGIDDLDQPLINSIVELLCDKIHSIKKRTMIGKGTEGDVYEWCVDNENCNYVVKIEKLVYSTEIYRKRELEKQQEDMDVLNMRGLSPKMRAIRYCSDEKVFLILMDKIRENTLSYYLNKKLISNEMMKSFIDNIIKVHKLGLYHGDLNPTNVFYNEKSGKFIFIDMRYHGKSYKSYYDYLTFMYFMKEYLENSDNNLMVFAEYLKLAKNVINNEMLEQGIKSDYCVNKVMKTVDKLIKLAAKYPKIEDEDEQIDAFIDYDILLEKLSESVQDLIYDKVEDCKIEYIK